MVALAMALAVMVAVMVLVRWSMMTNDAGDEKGRWMTAFVFPLQGRPAQSAHNPQSSNCSSTGAPEPMRRARRDAQVCITRTWHVWEPKSRLSHKGTRGTKSETQSYTEAESATQSQGRRLRIA
ncbi:hypothetical protein N9L68_07150 [bacterium]|nr:hypothetical protein [bacterium]